MATGARSALLVGVAMALAIGLGAGIAGATSTMNTTFKNLYTPRAGTALANARCLVCHAARAGSPTAADTKKFNPYGAALRAKGAKTNILKALKAVEQLDSDKDGQKNLAEIKKGTLPGDPRSK